MKDSKVLKAILLISGLMLTVFGAGILLMPVEMAALNGIELGGQISLLSETRSPGGSLLASGILVMSGAFVARLTFTAIVVSALIYLSYGLSRILSMAIDGMPAEGLVQVAVLEIVTGLVCVFALVKYRETE